MGEEIDLCQRIWSIEKDSFGDRLKVEWNIQATSLELKRVKIPLLTLQPLLENSIFMGLKKFLQKTISVLVEILQNQISIVITNPYSHDTIKSRKGNGIAIENVKKQRLKAYYGQTVKFQVYGECRYIPRW